MPDNNIINKGENLKYKVMDNLPDTFQFNNCIELENYEKTKLLN